MNEPPYYILFSHSSIATTNPGAPSKTLGHPAIQYHYANDSPLALRPQHPNEHVLILDYNPHSNGLPTIQSMSKDLAIASLKIEEAPGAAAANDNDPKNDRMYIIETTASDAGLADIRPGDLKSAHNVLQEYKRRNVVLRRALLYPNTDLPPRSLSAQVPHSRPDS